MHRAITLRTGNSSHSAKWKVTVFLLVKACTSEGHGLNTLLVWGSCISCPRVKHTIWIYLVLSAGLRQLISKNIIIKTKFGVSMSKCQMNVRFHEFSHGCLTSFGMSTVYSNTQNHTMQQPSESQKWRERFRGLYCEGPFIFPGSVLACRRARSPSKKTKLHRDILPIKMRYHLEIANTKMNIFSIAILPI